MGDELAQRLQLMSPPIAAGLHGGMPSTLARRRRNAAAHCFDIPVAVIASSSGAALNQLQRRRKAALAVDIQATLGSGPPS